MAQEKAKAKAVVPKLDLPSPTVTFSPRAHGSPKQPEPDEHKDNEQSQIKTTICSVHDMFNLCVSFAVVIDIRSGEEYAKGHIASSINIDASSVNPIQIDRTKLGKRIA